MTDTQGSTGEGPATPPGSPPGEDRATEVAVHLQRAALEFITAARVLLDVAEEAVLQPAGVVGVVAETIGALIGAAGDVLQARPATAPAPRTSADPERGSAQPAERIEHISIG